jgi:hypothetical protein
VTRAALAALLLAVTASGSAVSRPATRAIPPAPMGFRQVDLGPRTWPALSPASAAPAAVTVPVATAGPRRQPDVRPTAERKAPRPPRMARGGVATWFAAPAGTAAAGPALRRFLGRDWRGSVVRVCAAGRCIRVALTDGCACRARSGRPTFVDLAAADFARLAPLSRGVLDVRVSMP